MKLAKKTLSVFLSVLMLFSVCSVGLTGIVASAAEGDSAYTADEVAALVNAATAGGFTLGSGSDAWNYAGDDGKVIAAAEAIFDYAVNTYRAGKEADSAANSSKGLYDAFDAEFSSKYENATAARQLVKNVLNPDGTTVYSYESPAKKTGVTGAETKDSISKGADVSANYPLSSYGSYYAVTSTANVIKTSAVQLDLNAYLMSFAKIEDIPSTIITSVKYTYAHTYSTSAKVTNVTSRSVEEGSGCDKETVTYYTPTMETNYWNYMTGKPTREVVKDKTIRKGLLTLEKYFNEELLAMTQEDMLAMDVGDIKTLYLTTETMYESMANYSDTVLNHFGLNAAAIHNFMNTVDFAYRVVAGKYNIDILNNYIGSTYNEESYAEMSALYAKTNTAYNVVFNMDAEIVNYIVGEGNYAEQYASAIALKSAAESYNAVLFDIMTEQKLEETVDAMVATYTDYINVLNKEDIDNPSDAEVIGLVQKVEAFDAIIASYTGYSYYRTYWTAEYEAAWAEFSAKLDEVYEVRGLKMEFETYYDYFLPLIYTTQIDTLDNDAAISLHADLDTKIAELRDSYNEVAAKWGYTIADKIFTVVYEDADYLLQTLVENVKSAGKEAVKTVLIARTEAQLDAVYAYKDTTVVNFENFAEIKSTLTYFDYDLYNYVNGGGEGQNNWLSSEYTNKYSMVQTLLDRYHAFSTSDGKSYFNENFTYADANGNYAVRYAGSQTDAEGNEIGYPNDIARNGADDNYYVTEETLLNTIVKIDSFITSRDFGAIIGLVSTETEEYCDLATYVTELLNEMLYTDDLINTLVGAIYPMVVDLLNTELVGMLADMGENDNANASACIDLEAMEVDNAKGHLYVYMDDDLYNGKEHLQRNLDEVLADAGLYVYPQTLADSLLMSNPVAFGVGTPIYTALKAAGRDWTKLVCADDPETPEDETKVLDFAWGVYDAETFTDTLACVFDSLLPLLNAVLTGTTFNETLNNAAYVYSSDVKYSFISAGNIAAYGHLNLNIPGLTVYNDVLVPLFEILGVDKIPTLKSGASGDDLAQAIVKPLLGVLDEILLGKDAAPLTKILEILPNLVYFISMDSVQEILNSLNISLNLKIEAEIDKNKSGTLADLLGGTLVSLLGDNLAFDVELAIADMIDLYDMLGFEISDFNEILKFATASMGLNLPPIRQQDIIFCSDWGKSPTGRVYLNANEGDLIFWLIEYVVSALVPDENGNSLLTSLLGEDMDPMIAGVIETVVDKLVNDPATAFGAIIELLNPAEYSLGEMEWADGEYNYGDIEGASQMSIVYLNYGNDWTREKAEYLVDNVNDIIDAVLELTGGEMEDLGAMLQDMVNGLFTNANITALVEMLGGLGDSPSAIIADIVGTQVGIELDSWFTAFGYLYPASTWADDAEIVPLGHRNYVNNFGVEGVANEDGTITWSFNKMNLVDGDGYTFINILSRLLGGASVLVDFLFAGGDVSAFNGLLTLKGYETYATSLGLIFEVLGVDNLPTQEDFNNDAMGSLTNMLSAVLDWFYTLTSSEDMIKQVIEIIPDLFYFVESNGLSTVLRNLLQPVWVLVDTVRPLIDVDLNGTLSLVVSEFLNYGTLDINTVLTYVLTGVYQNNDMDYKWYNVDLFNLSFTKIIELADLYLGTNLATSGLVQIGIKGFCSGAVEEASSVGTIKTSSVDAADTLTILVAALLDCINQPASVEGKTNGDVIVELITELTGSEDVANLFPVILNVISGIEVEYADPNWGFMFESADQFSLTLPEQSIVYLGYTTDWTADTAASVYDALDDVLALVLPEVLGENETLATLLNGVLEDNVYTDEILVTVVELLVNALAGLDETLRGLVDVVVAADINAWFDMCTYNEETGAYECTKDWGVDAAEDKKATFVAAIKEVLAPANDLLAWVFFADEYAFFTGSEVDENGEYIYNDILTINGGEGYAYGLAPILEALGCELAPAATYYDAATGKYNVGDAVEGILDSVLALVDEISANPVEEVFALLPNLIYFINADGLKVAVSNLLAPVNGVIEALAPIISEDGSAVSLGALLEGTIGLNIEDISTATLLGFAADAGVQMTPAMVDMLCNLYIGKLAEFTSVNGRKAYRLDITGAEGDVLTIILSLALDLFNLNTELFADLLGADTYYAVYNLIRGASEAFTYRDMNWAFMYEGEDAASKLYNEGFPVREGDAYTVYTQYQNNWNLATADYLNEILDTLVKDITDAARSDGSSLGVLLDDAIVGGLYQDDILNSLIEAVVELLVDYEDLIKNAGALLGAEGLAVWFDEYCEITTDENGETVVTCVKDWGVDAAATNEEKREAFVEGFVEALRPAYRLLAWLLFGEEYTFLNGTTNDVLITIKGGEGYDNALVPLLEAVYATMNYEGTYSGIKPAAAFYDAEGNLDMEQAVRDVFTALSDWLYMICGDINGDGTLGAMLEILPNFMYFVNADGLKVVVNNLLQPVSFILDALKPMGVEVDFATLIEGVDLLNFDFYAVFDLLEDLLGLYFPDYTQNFFCTFYIGEPVAYESANGKLAYHIAYTEEESRRDMITCVISFVVDAFKDTRNAECLIGWMGEDIYNGIIDVLNITEEKPMEEFAWILTEYADSDKSFTGLETSKKYEVAYNKIWTEDKAEYIAENFPEFVDTILELLGLELNGYKVSSLDELLSSLLNGALYTQETADMLLDTVRDLIAQISNLEPYGEYVANVLDKALGVDITVWDTMTVTVVDGDRASFVAALEEIVAPIVPLLDLLLCEEDIRLFYTIDGSGEDALTIYGSAGYAYGIVPLFEALGCTMLTPAEFYALDDNAKVGAIIDPLLARVDEIAADPANELLDMLPAITYFINSNGLDTAVNNILNSVDTVLAALEPLVGETSLMALLGVDLKTLDFDYLMNLAADAVAESTGLDISTIVLDFVAELTTGKVVSYQSANGETYYTMQYAGEWQKADMVTIVLRLVIEFLAEGDNEDAIIALIGANSQSEDATSSASSLIKFILTAIATEPVSSGAMATLYWIFYGLNEATTAVDNGINEFNHNWSVILTYFESNGDPVTSKAAEVLRDVLDTYFDGIFDSQGVAPEGAMTFFDKLKAFFQKIGDFFRKLFGMA